MISFYINIVMKNTYYCNINKKYNELIKFVTHSITDVLFWCLSLKRIMLTLFNSLIILIVICTIKEYLFQFSIHQNNIMKNRIRLKKVVLFCNLQCTRYNFWLFWMFEFYLWLMLFDGIHNSVFPNYSRKNVCCD